MGIPFVDALIAEEDGFKKGDIISGIDQKPATQFTLGELRECLARVGEHHELRITRGGKVLAIAIEVRLISIERN